MEISAIQVNIRLTCQRQSLSVSCTLHKFAYFNMQAIRAQHTLHNYLQNLIIRKWIGLLHMQMLSGPIDHSIQPFPTNKINAKIVHFTTSTHVWLGWLGDFDQHHKIIPNGPKLLRKSINILKYVQISSINLNKYDTTHLKQKMELCDFGKNVRRFELIMGFCSKIL